MGLFRRKRNASDAQDGPAASPVPDAAADSEQTLEDVMAEQARELAGLAEAVFHPAPLPGPLDFTRSSLEVLDRTLGVLHDRRAELPISLQNAAAAYIFEVARREFGGRLLSYREEDPLILVVGEPDFEAALAAYSKVRGRVVNGPEDNIPFFYDGLVSAVAQRRSALII